MAAFQDLREVLEVILMVQNKDGKRRCLWWDHEAPGAVLRNIDDCLKWAIQGGIRAGVIAFCGRASFNILLTLLRIRSFSLRRLFEALAHAVVGTSTLRFSMMLSSFVALYKFLLNGLPILSSRLFKERRQCWHATVAGAIAGGLAILFESSERRLTIAQQAFVRGLQGNWNSYTKKRNIYIPHGDVLLFVLAVFQIGYAWEVRQDTLPRWYSQWISKATQAPPAALRIKKDLVAYGRPDVEDINELLELPELTAANATQLEEYRRLLTSPTPNTYIPSYVPCFAIHCHDNSCLSSTLMRVLSVGKGVVPLYAAVHFLWPLLYNRRSIAKSPLSFAGNATLRTARSSAFLGLLIALYQIGHCGKHQLHELFRTVKSPTLKSLISQSTVDGLLVSKQSYYLPGILAGLSVLAEEKHRRSELAMYVFPKALESAWLTMGFGGRVKHGEVLLASVGMAMVMTTYQNDPKQLSGIVRRILYQFVGPN